MTRRSALVALAFAGAAQLSSGCQCVRPLFPRLRECLGCGPVPVAAAAPVGLPVGVAPPPAFSPAFAPPAGDIGGPGCATCAAGPVGAPIGHPVQSLSPVTGPVILDPGAVYPVKGDGPIPGYPVPQSGPPLFTGQPSTLLPPPQHATPMPAK